MIGLKDVEKVYRTAEIETLALSGINLSIREGEFVSVMGPSGSGKSTLLNVIGLLDEPSQGTIQLNGQVYSASYRFRALLWEADDRTYFLVASMAAIDDVWGLAVDLAPSDRHLDRFLWQEIVPHVKVFAGH